MCSIRILGEQISPPCPRRFAPAEAPKFLPSIQLTRRAEAGNPIPAARSPIPSKSARFVDLGGNSDGIHALLAAHLPPITSNSARFIDLGGNSDGIHTFSRLTFRAITSKSARFVDLGGNSDGIHTFSRLTFRAITSKSARFVDLGGNEVRILGEQISPPCLRRFAPAEAPKFLPSIQLTRRVNTGNPIPAARSPITSKSARFVDSGGNEVRILGEQISPPCPRRFAPAEAPKFLPSIQLTRRESMSAGGDASTRRSVENYHTDCWNVSSVW